MSDSESMSLFLSSLEREWSEACSCDECGSKIAKLKEFEKEIEAKTKLIMKYADKLQKADHIGLIINSTSWWTTSMLDILHRKLKAVSKKPFTIKKSPSAENLRNIAREINKLRNGSEEPVHDYDDYDVNNDDDEDTNDVLEEIDTGRFYYNHTKAKDAANLIFDRIEYIEKDHVKAKENAVAQKIKLETSISKNHIEEQVKLVKKLPVEELKLELEGLFDEIQPLDKNWLMVLEARQCISNIEYAEEASRMMFWEGSPKGNGHISNGVNQTLDKLIVKVTKFKDEWKKVYAPFFTRDRANPKRQRTTWED